MSLSRTSSGYLHTVEEENAVGSRGWLTSRQAGRVLLYVRGLKEPLCTCGHALRSVSTIKEEGCAGAFCHALRHPALLYHLWHSMPCQ